MIEKHFYIQPLVKNGKKCLLIRRFISNEKEMGDILNEIITTGKLDMHVIIMFKNPFMAKARLKQLGFLNHKAPE
jgi:hypothetical protein